MPVEVVIARDAGARSPAGVRRDGGAGQRVGLAVEERVQFGWGRAGVGAGEEGGDAGRVRGGHGGALEVAPLAAGEGGQDPAVAVGGGGDLELAVAAGGHDLDLALAAE